MTDRRKKIVRVVYQGSNNVGPVPIDGPLDDLIRSLLAVRGSIPSQWRSSAICSIDTDWRPIETAPKDGTLILVAGPKMGVMFDATAITVVAWGGFEWKPMVGGWQAYEDSLEDAQPTHWMPLPDPPVRTEIA